MLRHRASGSGSVVAPLPLADDRVSALLEAGDQVDVLAADSQTGKTRVVATAIRVVTGCDTGGERRSGHGRTRTGRGQSVHRHSPGRGGLDERAECRLAMTATRRGNARLLMSRAYRWAHPEPPHT